MPTQVQTRPQNDRIMSPHHMHDPHSIAEHELANNNALRLALGSILAPKRTSSHSPGSRSGSTSGTASPALPWHFPTVPTSTSPLGTPAPPPPPPHSTPIHSHGYVHAPQSHGHSHLHPNPHANYPSRFGLPRSNSEDSMLSSRGHNAESTEGPSSPYAPHHTLGGFEPEPNSPEAASPQRSQMRKPSISVSPPTIHAPAPKPHSDFPTSPSATSNEDGSEVGGGTPKAKWIETLQSKRAWDALIHGSFS